MSIEDPFCLFPKTLTVQKTGGYRRRPRSLEFSGPAELTLGRVKVRRVASNEVASADLQVSRAQRHTYKSRLRRFDSFGFEPRERGHEFSKELLSLGVLALPLHPCHVVQCASFTHKKQPEASLSILITVHCRSHLRMNA